MNTINLSVRNISKIFWEIIYLNKDLLQNDFRAKFFNELNNLEKLRSIANYNTGSISLSSAFSLFLLIKHFKPMRILEIGTFIGKSTISMARAMDEFTDKGEIFTCDHSNEIKLPFAGNTKITQFMLQDSTKMLECLTGKFDLIFIDGRLKIQDIKIILNLITDKSIIVFDDFEGIEKGIANLMLLRESKELFHHFQINPPSEEFLKLHDFQSHSLLGLLVPVNEFKLTNQ
ncbi:MAG: O-methyltransferase [Candidatus Fonsibacter lacus]